MTKPRPTAALQIVRNSLSHAQRQLDAGISPEEVLLKLNESTACIYGDAPECDHEPEGHTITYAGDRLICDVSCRNCGKSGSFEVDPGDINWE
jgi:hypothetical protein